MFRRKRLFIRLVFSALLLAGLAGGGLFAWRWLHPAALPPLEVSLWYWHQPFRLPPREIAELKALGVRRLFVHAGTFRRTDHGIRLVLPQQWADRADGLEIHLVFNFDYNIVRDYGALDNETLAAAVEEGVGRERARAEAAGLRIGGSQLDFDCPTRRLPKYAALLHRLRAVVGRGQGNTAVYSGGASPAPTSGSQTAFSITALPTWFGSDDVRRVMDEVDFTVPQYYEAQIPRRLDAFATVSRLAMVARGLRAAGRTGRPFYAGLPAYGHALVYNGRDDLIGTYHDMGVQDVVRNPAFRLARAIPLDAAGQPATRATYIGEDLFDFRAPAPEGDATGHGYHLVYDLPSPAMVAQHVALVRAQRPRNCLGVILFRYPEPGETQTLPLPSIAAALQGAPTQPQLRVRLTVASAPWELIETGRRAERAPLDLTATVTNTGAAGTFLAPDAVTLTLCFDRPGLDDAPPHGFEAMESYFDGQARPGRAPDNTLLRSSLARANVVRFRRFLLRAGETVKAGPIRIPADGATKVWGSWSATGVGGFDVMRGDIAPMALTAQN